jgi:hypothetical protein
VATGVTGVRVYGLVCKIQDLAVTGVMGVTGFRVYGSGFRVQDLGVTGVRV